MPCVGVGILILCWGAEEAAVWVKFVVLAIFDSQNWRDAKVGEKDPVISRSNLGDAFERLGVKSPFGKEKEFEPMYYLVRDNRPIGYARVYKEEMYARMWFRMLRDRKDIYAIWRDGLPLVWSKNPRFGDGNQFLHLMVICKVRAFTDESAAQKAWEGFSSDRLASVETYFGQVSDGEEQIR